MNYIATGQQAACSMRQRPSPPASDKIVQHDEASRRTRHRLQKMHRIRLLEMMQEQRANNRIVLLGYSLGEHIKPEEPYRDLISFRPRFGVVQGAAADVARVKVQCDAVLFCLPRKIHRVVTPSACDIKHVQRG